MRWARLTCAHTLASQTFLAKDDVAERIMMVVKNHEKVRAARSASATRSSTVFAWFCV